VLRFAFSIELFKGDDMPRWTPEARQRQAELIHTWKPWRASTGPRTEAGKAASRQNAYLTGWYAANEGIAMRKEWAQFDRRLRLLVRRMKREMQKRRRNPWGTHGALTDKKGR